MGHYLISSSELTMGDVGIHMNAPQKENGFFSFDNSYVRLPERFFGA